MASGLEWSRELDERRSDSGYELRVGLIGFADKLDVEYEREELVMSFGGLQEKRKRTGTWFGSYRIWHAYYTRRQKWHQASGCMRLTRKGKFT